MHIPVGVRPEQMATGSWGRYSLPMPEHSEHKIVNNVEELQNSLMEVTPSFEKRFIEFTEDKLG